MLLPHLYFGQCPLLIGTQKHKYDFGKYFVTMFFVNVNLSVNAFVNQTTDRILLQLYLSVYVFSYFTKHTNVK